MLQRATAAGAKMLADRFGAFMAALFDMHEMPSVRMPGDRFNRHDLAGQSIGNVDRPLRRFGDAITAMTEAGDCQLLRHA